MAIRKYEDSAGREWNVWEVPPRFSPLRSPLERRQSARTPAIERRLLPVRRLTTAPPEWIYGWLCFQSGADKRRLCPLPPDWENESSDELEEYRQRATLVRSS